MKATEKQLELIKKHNKYELELFGKKGIFTEESYFCFKCPTSDKCHLAYYAYNSDGKCLSGRSD